MEKHNIDIEDKMFEYRTKYRVYMDKITPMTQERYLFLFIITLLFAARIYSSKVENKFAVIAYCLAVDFLKNLMLFLSPGDSYMQELEIAVETDYVLPMRESDEFKPFQRKKPEMEVWKSLTGATLCAHFMTMFECFDFPIYIPILIMYFIVITILLFKVKLAHMQKFQYNPFDYGKKLVYTGSK